MSANHKSISADIDEDDIDLSALADDELVAQMHDDLYDGLLEEIVEGTEILLARGWGPDKVLNDALVQKLDKEIDQLVALQQEQKSLSKTLDRGFEMEM